MDKFKSSTGSWVTQGLFYEAAFNTKEFILYTLKDQDHVTKKGELFLSLKRLYLDSVTEDPTEYSFSVTYLGGWKHWKAIRDSQWFAPYYAEWIEERDIRIKSNALKNLHIKANNPDDKESFQANKFIISNGFGDTKEKVGRPSKQKIKEEAIKLFQEGQTIEDDLKRIMQ